MNDNSVNSIQEMLDFNIIKIHWWQIYTNQEKIASDLSLFRSFSYFLPDRFVKDD